ncbi:MAG: response regulator transcription factor [Lachnospiraceae bacterium]|nr:response regulator transcription factor [Lachnospiraceae bacterium]
MGRHILFVEDDHSIASGLIYVLEQEGYTVTYCKDVVTALKKVCEIRFDLALLDMQLPDGLGKEIGQALKRGQTPVIYLTIVDDEDEIVRSLEDGAADYITKPFRVRELLARIKRTLHEEKEASQTLKIGDAVIDAEAGKVYIGDRLITLTALEYRLLLIFAENQDVLLTREQLLERIWDISGDFVEDNTLTVYVKRLRQKLGDAVHITTVRGIGYRVD